MKYLIEKNRPIPRTSYNEQAVKTGRPKSEAIKTLDKMEIGDCVHFWDIPQNRSGHYTRAVLPKKFTTRKEISGCRIWRVE